MGHSQRLVLARKSRRRHLRNHESRIQSRLRGQERWQHARQRIRHLLDAPLHDSAEGRNRDRHLVRRHRQRLPVKISAADDVAVVRIPHKNERIVRRTVQLHSRHFPCLPQRIPYRPVYLRRATQAVRILHARIFFRRAMRLANLAALIQVRKIPPCRRGTRVRSRMHDARVERAGTPAQSIQRKGSGHIRGVHENVRFSQRKAQ